MEGPLGQLPRALIIAIIPAEARAIYAHLEERETIVGPKGTLYDVGRYADPAGDWTIVVAHSSPGNVSAASTVTRAHADFGGDFTAQLVVGVGGSLKEDVPIGSVVVAEMAYNAHSGKEIEAGLQTRPHGSNSHHVLLAAARKAVIEGDWVELLKSPYKFELPSPAEYPKACPYPPDSFLKPVASTEVVLSSSNGALYKLIRSHYNDAAAVEMEGYGALKAAEEENTPAIVIRGISDRCDGKDPEKDANLQPIAAAHAAAMAMKILSIRSLAGEGRGSTKTQPAIASLAENPTEIATAKAKTSIVVNFEGQPADFTADRLSELRAVLIQLTGDEALEITDVQNGSARIIVEVDEEAASSLSGGRLQQALTGDLRRDFRGVGSLEQLDDATLAPNAFAQASRELLAWERTLPGGTWLERPELDELTQRIVPGEGTVSVLLGEPGSGKSALLSALSQNLQETDTPVLAIKADLLPNTVETEADLKDALGLSTLPSEALLASSILGPVVLVIDQLDALAGQVDLKTGRLNVLLNLVRQVSDYDNIHVVLSARTFEYNHDVRLKVVGAEAINLQLPPWSAVAEVLALHHIDTDSWPEDARNVVRVPQALKTLLAVHEKVGKQEVFLTYQAMLERLWKERILSQEDAPALSSLASTIALYMAEEETLWVAAARLDAQTPLVQKLLSSNILVRSENELSIGFSHQTVFDHVLARTFLAAQRSLATYVAERQQSLFVRGKLWSALNFLRGAETTSYEREMQALWEAELRRHLKFLLIEFLGSQGQPTEFEERLFVEALTDPKTRVIAINAMIGSVGWLRRLTAYVRGLMRGTPEEAWIAYRILLPIWQTSFDDASPLVDECWASNPSTDDHLWALLENAPKWDEHLEQLAQQMILRTPVAPMRIDNLAASVAVDDPKSAARIALSGLNKQLAQAREWKGKPRPEGELTHDQRLVWQIENDAEKPYEALLRDGEWSSLPDLATHSPAAYLEILWPFYREVFQDLASLIEAREDRYPTSHRLQFEFGDGGPSPMLGEQSLLSALRVAVEGVADSAPAEFLAWLDHNKDLAFTPHQALIANTLRRSAEGQAAFALEWLLEDLRRLELGDISSPRRATAALVAAAAPFWSDEQLAVFENTVLAYAPSPPPFVQESADLRRTFRRHIRLVRRHLLSVLPPERLSTRASELLKVEERALEAPLDAGVSFSGVQAIGSPMSTEAMLRAKDRDILNAFEEVPDSADWDHPRAWMKGGNIQLSRAFSEFAKQAPARAIRLIGEFQPGRQERAAGYAIDALAEAQVDAQQLETLILDLDRRGFTSSEFVDSVARAIDRLAGRKLPLPEKLVSLLERWLDTADVTFINSNEAKSLDDRDDTQRGSILWGYGGFAVLPAGAFTILNALTAHLLDHGFEGRDRLMAIFTKHLARDKRQEIWQPILRRLAHAGGDKPEPASTFLRALFAEIPTLLVTSDALFLLAHAQWWDHHLVHDLLEAWKASPINILRQGYGELICLISLANKQAEWAPVAVEEALEGADEFTRAGIAYGAANLFAEPDHKTRAGAILVRLLAQASKPEMAGILDVFRVANPLTADAPTLELMRAVSATPANLTEAHHSFLIDAMQSLLPHAAGPIGTICRRLVDEWREELANISSGIALQASEIADLALTLHRLGGPSREVGVQVFEALVEINAYGARETLVEIDGRFDRKNAYRRRRIPRSARRGRSRTARTAA